MNLVVCKGGPREYGDDFAGLWRAQPERRPGRDGEPLFLTAAVHDATALTLAVLERFLRQVDAAPDHVQLVTRRAHLDEAQRAGRLGILLAANRSDWFGDSPTILHAFARLGLRMITLSQGMRDLGYDAWNESRPGGLTDLGVRLIGAMNEAGIVIDLSHTHERSARDIIDASSRPCVASHSNPRELDPSARNASREFMVALAARGGVLGILPPIARPPAEQPYERIPADSLAATVRLILHAVDAIGAAHVGIGTHFNTAVLPAVIDALSQAGLPDDDVRAVAGGNFLRLLREVLPA
jgi:membrane dipeptidase